MGLIELMGIFLVKKDSLNQLKAPQCSTQSLARIYDLRRRRKKKKKLNDLDLGIETV